MTEDLCLNLGLRPSRKRPRSTLPVNGSPPIGPRDAGPGSRTNFLASPNRSRAASGGADRDRAGEPSRERGTADPGGVHPAIPDRFGDDHGCFRSADRHSPRSLRPCQSDR